MTARGALEVVEPGPLATVQDLGRPGCAALGVSPSGAADRRSLRLANRLLGNAEGAAAIEATFGGLAVRARADLLVAVTGADTPVAVDTHGAATNAVLALRTGATLRLGPPAAGLRSYVAVRGGLDVPPVLGSRSTDVLAGLGPAPLRAGDVLPVGTPPAAFPPVEIAPVAGPCAGDVTLRVVAGPRDDWFRATAWSTLLESAYVVSSRSDRVGMRLDGPVLQRSREGELPSEGMVRGALQVPPTGQPVLFLSDHPVTGGYPVIAVVVAADVDLAAQARPGQRLRFTGVREDRLGPRERREQR